MIELCPPVQRDLGALARLWHHGWHEAHAAYVPTGLQRLRTLDDFQNRLEAMLEHTMVCGAKGEPAGFCTIREGELMHLFVAGSARGSGVAVALLSDGEQRLAKSGIRTAWLGCVIGNTRAAHFYEKSGWTKSGVTTYRAETKMGVFALEEWRYEKRLDRGPVTRSSRRH